MTLITARQIGGQGVKKGAGAYKHTLNTSPFLELFKGGREPK